MTASFVLDAEFEPFAQWMLGSEEDRSDTSTNDSVVLGGKDFTILHKVLTFRLSCARQLTHVEVEDKCAETWIPKVMQIQRQQQQQQRSHAGPGGGATASISAKPTVSSGRVARLADYVVYQLQTLMEQASRSEVPSSGMPRRSSTLEGKSLSEAPVSDLEGGKISSSGMAKNTDVVARHRPLRNALYFLGMFLKHALGTPAASAAERRARWQAVKAMVDDNEAVRQHITQETSTSTSTSRTTTGILGPPVASKGTLPKRGEEEEEEEESRVFVLLASVLDFVVRVPLTRTNYALHLSVLRFAFVLLSVQVLDSEQENGEGENGLPPLVDFVVHRLFDRKRAGTLVATLLRRFCEADALLTGLSAREVDEDMDDLAPSESSLDHMVRSFTHTVLAWPKVALFWLEWKTSVPLSGMASDVLHLAWEKSGLASLAASSSTQRKRTRERVQRLASKGLGTNGSLASPDDVSTPSLQTHRVTIEREGSFEAQQRLRDAVLDVVEGDAVMEMRLSQASLLLLAVLVHRRKSCHYPLRTTTWEANPFRWQLLQAYDEGTAESTQPTSTRTTANAAPPNPSTSTDTNTSTIVHTTTQSITSSLSVPVSMAVCPGGGGASVSFDGVLTALVMQDTFDDISVLAFYYLMQNKRFADFFLAKTDPEVILVPLLHLLYSNNSAVNPKQTFLCLSVLVQCTASPSFCAAVQWCVLEQVTWTKPRSVHQITLGSLMHVVGTRVLLLNLSQGKDETIHQLAFALLLNLSGHMDQIHPFVCDKLVRSLLSMGRSWLALADADAKQTYRDADTDKGGEDDEATTTVAESECVEARRAQMYVYAEVLLVIGQTIDVAMICTESHNPALIYAAVRDEEALTRLLAEVTACLGASAGKIGGDTVVAESHAMMRRSLRRWRRVCHVATFYKKVVATVHTAVVDNQNYSGVLTRTWGQGTGEHQEQRAGGEDRGEKKKETMESVTVRFDAADFDSGDAASLVRLIETNTALFQSHRAHLTMDADDKDHDKLDVDTSAGGMDHYLSSYIWRVIVLYSGIYFPGTVLDMLE